MKEPLPENLGEIHFARSVETTGMEPHEYRRVIIILALSVALMMTGFGIIMPIFARRLGEIGEGVQGLGLMTMSFALAQFIAAPFMGTLADRFGRRPLIILGLITFALANIGFLFAQQMEAFIVVRSIEGALTAGLFPAAMGAVADVVPQKERARWVGIVMGSYAAGFALGPILGGVLYDSFGYAAPFVISAVMGVIALVFAIIMVPETRTREIRNRDMLNKRRTEVQNEGRKVGLLESLPKPGYLFTTLLFTDFIIVFAFAFVEPQMVFYFYDDLGWSTVQFGVVVALYGLFIVVGQAVLGQLSDRIGRKPVILLGTALYSFFFLGLALFTSYPIMLLVAVIAGLGEALMMPALSAFYIDITREQYRSRIMGLKESAAALGGVAGPLLVIAVSSWLDPIGVFMVAFILLVVTFVVGLIFLREPAELSAREQSYIHAYSGQRSFLAQATLQGIVTSAQVVRYRRKSPTG